MGKKLLRFCLLLSMLAALLSLSCGAEEEDLETIIQDDYVHALEESEREDLRGYCGLFASWQLKFRGINTVYFSADGRDYYDIYSQMTTTTGGYPVKLYSAEDYTLSQALRAVTANGTRDASNILVGFQWTNTEAGAKYGHTVFVYAVKNGMVYFTESFSTSFGTKAGEMIATSIDRFENYYAGWTEFEGIVYFGEKDYLSKCIHYPSNIYVETESKNSLLPEPRLDSTSALGRTVLPGEKLWVTGVYQNPEGELYYQIEEDGEIFYLIPEATHFLDINPDAVVRMNGESGLSGRVMATHAVLSELHLDATDWNDQVIYSKAIKKNADFYELGAPEIREKFQDYNREGNPVFTVVVRNYYVDNGRLGCCDRTVEPRTLCSSAPGRISRMYDSAWMYYCWKNQIQTGWLPYSGMNG